MLASILTLSALLASFCILSTPAPVDLALLQNARTPVSGASGFATLTATLEATASLPSEIPRMEKLVIVADITCGRTRRVAAGFAAVAALYPFPPRGKH